MTLDAPAVFRHRDDEELILSNYFWQQIITVKVNYRGRCVCLGRFLKKYSKESKRDSSVFKSRSNSRDTNN